MKKIYAKDLESAAKMVDLMYNITNPRQGEWLREPGYISCYLRDGRHISIQETINGLVLENNDPEYNEHMNVA